MKNRIALMLLLLALAPAYANAWWSADWSFRKKISLNTSATGVETKTNADLVPVLVRLHSGNFSFLDAKEDGSDLRFVANDDKTPLKFHIEQFESVNQLAAIWVQLPRLTAGSAAEYIWVYSGNPKAPPGDDAKGSYDVAQTAVYHFTEKSGLPKDSTAYANNAAQATAALGTPGLIGIGASFNGSGKIVLPASPSLKVAAAKGFAFSAWLKPAETQANIVLFEQQDGERSIVVGIEGDKPYAEAKFAATPVKASASVALAGGKWQHIAVTLKDKLTVYVNGVDAGNVAVAAADLGGAITIGDRAAGGAGYKGELDEVKLFGTAPAPEVIKVAAQSEGLDGKLLTFGEDEQSDAGGSSYFRILLSAVTLDGWVVIGILGIMAVISVLVMVTKALFIGKLQKGNQIFQSQFQKLSTELLSIDREVQAAGGKEKGGNAAAPLQAPEVQDSCLYRIYHVGVRELKRRFDLHEKSGTAKSLSPQAINAIKASLDAGLVREVHRLNSRMVLLTIAISGGPFLGLLGTVVGVMITFAAIAASGDVNVNAIAPGIAAALVATVAGLGVAIPALFGYNYLTSRIKDITAEMQVFADELVTKLAEVYAV